MPDGLAALVSFVDEHHRCGELDGGRDGGAVWLRCTCGAQITHSRDGESEALENARMDDLMRARTALAVEAWWDDPAYQACNTLHLRGTFILQKLRAHDPIGFDELMSDLYAEDLPEPEEIGRLEWRTILAFMGASEAEMEDVQMRMGRPWRRSSPASEPRALPGLLIGTVTLAAVALAPTAAAAWPVSIVATVNRTTISIPTRDATFSTQGECEASIPRTFDAGARP